MFKIIKSSSLMIALIALYAIALGAATFVEHSYGTLSAREWFYTSWWMIVLQALLCVNFVAMAYAKGLWRQRKWGAMMLHYGFILVLIGALTSHLTAVEGVIHIRENQSSSSIMNPKGEKIVSLPFQIHLKKFQLQRHSGFGSPSSYQSQVTIEGSEYTISMNKPLSYGGWRLYQSSFDTDEQGSYLLASSDETGTAITYIAYIMLAIGMVMAIVHKKSRFRRLLGTLSMLIISLQCLATTPNTVAQKFERLMVQTADARVQTMGSYAEDLLRKIARKKTYNNLSATEVLLGITTNPYRWSTEKFILNTDGKTIAFVDLIGPDSEYVLAEKVNLIYRKPPQKRTKTEKEILKLDERINILDNLFSGHMFAIFPRENTQQWYSPADDLSSFTGRDSLLVSKIFGWFTEQYNAGNNAKATQILDMIAIYQNAKGNDIHPRRIEAEILYNRLDIFKWGGFGYMGTGLCLVAVLIIILLYSSPGLRILATTLIAIAMALFLWQSFGLALRWYISQRAPWTNAYESMVYVSWAAALAGLIFLRRSRITFALSIFLSGVLLFVSNLSWMDPAITPLVPVLNSYWLIIHVAVITASYGFFGIGFLLGLSTIILIALQKPPLTAKIHELTVINTLAITLGLVLLVAGTFLGAIWANESWGRYWGWDPKETWALVTIVVYALILHMNFIKSLNSDYALAIGSIIALGAVLMTFFGVNYYLTGMHSYGADSAPPALTLIYIIYGAILILAIYAFSRSKRARLTSTPHR